MPESERVLCTSAHALATAGGGRVLYLPNTGMKKTDSAKLDQIITTLADVVEGFGKRFDKIDREMATKDQIVALHGQVNAIERQLRETKTEVRLGALEDKVFGAPRR